MIDLILTLRRPICRTRHFRMSPTSQTRTIDFPRVSHAQGFLFMAVFNNLIYYFTIIFILILFIPICLFIRFFHPIFCFVLFANFDHFYKISRTAPPGMARVFEIHVSLNFSSLENGEFR